MSWEFIFALLKKYYSFSIEELSELTLAQINSYLESIPEVHKFLEGDGSSEEEIKKEVTKEDLIEMVKVLKHRLPKGLK